LSEGHSSADVEPQFIAFGGGVCYGKLLFTALEQIDHRNVNVTVTQIEIPCLFDTIIRDRVQCVEVLQQTMRRGKSYRPCELNFMVLQIQWTNGKHSDWCTF